MNVKLKITLPDFDRILTQMTPTEEDIVELAGIIVDGICHRIRNEGVTADGRPLSDNSPSWTAQKLREGRYTRPLMYTGQMSLPDAFEIAFEGDRAVIRLGAEYQQVHLDLIDISNKTGKNYQDFFGISEEDIELCYEAMKEILITKIKRANQQ